MVVPPIVLLAAKMAADKAMSNMAKDDADQENYMESRSAERRNKAPDLSSVGEDSGLSQALLSKAVSSKVESLLNKPKEVPAPQDKGMAPLTPPPGQDQGFMPRTPPGTDRGFDKAKPLPPAEQFKIDFNKQNPQHLLGQEPGYLMGGISTTPHRAWLSEDGKPEAIVPLDRQSIEGFMRVFGDTPRGYDKLNTTSNWGSALLGDAEDNRKAPSWERFSNTDSQPSDYSSANDIWGENTPYPKNPRSNRGEAVDTKRHGFWEKAAGLIGDSPLKAELGASENPFINALVLGAHLYTHSKLKDANDEVAQRQAEKKKQLKGWEEEDKQYQRDVRSVARQRIAGRRARARAEAAQQRYDQRATERQQRFQSTHVQTPDGKWAPVPRPGSGKDPIVVKIRNFRKQLSGNNRIFRNKKSSLMRVMTTERNLRLTNGDKASAAMLPAQFDEAEASNDRRWQDLQVEEIANNFRSKLYESDDLDTNEGSAEQYLQGILSENIPENMKLRIKSAIKRVWDEHSSNFGGR